MPTTLCPLPVDLSGITATDLFCGAGGSSLGAEQAGATVTVAVNHWETAVLTHSLNHNEAQQFVADLSNVNPARFPTTTIAMMSPECTWHSKTNKLDVARSTADGRARVDSLAAEKRRSRATMWAVPAWVERHRYDAVIVENVPQAALWPNFAAWRSAVHDWGYDSDVVFINSLTASVPQTRDRMYVVFYRKGMNQPNLSFEIDAWCQACATTVKATQRFRARTDYWPMEAYGEQLGRQYSYACTTCSAQADPVTNTLASVIDFDAPSAAFASHGDFAKWQRQFAADLFVRDMRRYVPTMLERVAKAFAYRPDCSAFLLPSFGNRFERDRYTRSRPVNETAFTLTCGDSLALVSRHDAGPDQTALHGTWKQHPRSSFPSWNGTTGLHDAFNARYRLLTTAEYAAIAGFPSDYQLAGSAKDQLTQLGNAVSPAVMKLLVERVGAAVSSS
jgi:DNA (cytosine-5)-methyltransferase 1